MSQSSILREQMADLAEVAEQLDDNKELQAQIDRRIEALERTTKVIEAKEAREAEEKARRVKLADSRTDIAKRVQAVAADLGKDDGERQELKRVIEGLSDNCEDATCTKCPLCKFDYLKGKGLTKKQIRLVLGI